MLTPTVVAVLELPDLRDHQAPQAQADHQAPLVPLGQLAPLVLPDLLEQLAPVVDPQARPGPQAQLVRAVLPVDLLELPARPGQPAQVEQRAQPVLSAPRDQPARRG